MAVVGLYHRKPVVTYLRAVFSFMGSLSLDHYHFYFLMTLKELLTFQIWFYNTMHFSGGFPDISMHVTVTPCL